ncbi:hypothetical protein BSKO_03093 [Bryopsis sp. KO-2023]|nr:hypothetical protein BSKO_03093 [Bryopsis sp. KO-2023]
MSMSRCVGNNISAKPAFSGRQATTSAFASPVESGLRVRRSTFVPVDARINAKARTIAPSKRNAAGRLNCQADDSPSVTTTDPAELYSELAFACQELRLAPPSVKYDLSADVKKAFEDLKSNDVLAKWGKEMESLRRRNIFMGDLRMMGIKDPAKIAIPTVRNDLAFIVTVVGVTSVLAVAAGQLPGDWGFWGSYLIGGISLGVLAVGSTAPGLLSFFIDKFSRVFPDYRERLLRHEAAHFLMGYLMGVPITGYSLDIGKEHTDFAEAKLQRRLIAGALEDSEIDVLAVVAMAGVAAEAVVFEEVVGQTADLFDLQRIMNRSKVKLSDSQQQNVTRWAVFQAAQYLKRYSDEYEALMESMKEGKSVADCVKAIEAVA